MQFGDTQSLYELQTCAFYRSKRISICCATATTADVAVEASISRRHHVDFPTLIPDIPSATAVLEEEKRLKGGIETRCG